MNLGSLLGNESAFGRLMTKCGTIIAVNILFAVSCIPFFTIGAAGAAMYHAIFEVLNADEDKTGQATVVHPLKAYWRGLRKTFVQATLCWLVFVAVMVLGFINLQVCAQRDGFAQYMSAGVIAVMIVAVVAVVYLLPVLGMFTGKLTGLVKLSIHAAMAHPLQIPVNLFLNIAPVVLLCIDEVNRPTYAFVGAFFAFGLIAYIIAKRLLPQFKTYLQTSVAVSFPQK